MAEEKTIKDSFPGAFTRLDLLFFACLVYLLPELTVYPVGREYILTIAGLAVVYLIFRQIPIRLITGLLYLLPVSVVAQTVYSYNHFEYPWQTLSDITGIFNNTGIFGGFVAMGFVATTGLLISAKRPVTRITLGLLLIPVTIQLIYSHSRAAWVAVVCGMLILLLPIFSKLTKSKLVFIIPILIIAGIVFSIKLYHFKKDSADGRLLIWTVSWNMIKEKPITGYGIGGFKRNYLLKQGEYFKNHPDSRFADLADDVAYPYNEFMKTWIEHGIIGLLFACGIIILIFSNTASPPVLRAVLAALIGFSFFSYPFEIIAFQVLGIFCPAGIASAQKPVVIAGLTRNPIKLTALCLIITFSGFILLAVCNYYADLKKWNRIIRFYSPKNSQQAIEGLQALYPAFKHNDKFVFIYGKILSDAGRFSEALPLLESAKNMFPRTQALIVLGEAYEKTDAYAKALEAWETASYIKPSLFKPHYDMAMLYFKLKNYEQAKQKANEILNKKIKIDNPEIDQMKRDDPKEKIQTQQSVEKRRFVAWRTISSSKQS